MKCRVETVIRSEVFNTAVKTISLQELGNVSPTGSETSPYEDVPISPSSVYTELNRNRRDTTDDVGYQKLVKHHSGHMIPADDETGSYEEVRSIGWKV